MSNNTSLKKMLLFAVAFAALAFAILPASAAPVPLDARGNGDGSAGSKDSGKASGKPSGGSSSGKGLAGMSGSCGASGATQELPNGSQDFLNCGVDAGGWNPPKVKLSDLKVVDPESAASGAFSACAKYTNAFKQAAAQHNIPAVMLMSFAMQESTCNPNAVGGNGERGMMQITPDKCGGAPGGNCKDPVFNIGKGAEYFTSQLQANGGNVLLAIGQYNGWSKGLTVAKATAAKKQGHCAAQNNLDYIFQMLNGWMQGKDGYSMGKYQNLKGCN